MNTFQQDQEKSEALDNYLQASLDARNKRFVDKRTATREAILNSEARVEDIFSNYDDMISGYEANASIYSSNAQLSMSVRGNQQRAINEAVDAAAEGLVGSEEMVSYMNQLRDIAIEEEARAETDRLAYEAINAEAVTDPWQASVMLDEQEGRSGSVSRRVDYITKLSRLSSVVEEIEQDADGRFFLMGAVDFILGELPYVGSQTRTGNVDIDDSLKRWYDAWLSGERQNREASTIWAARPGEFERMARELAPRIRANNKYLFYRNKSRAIRSAREVINTPDAAYTNFEDFLTNVPVASLVTKKGYSVIGNAARMGNRRKAYEILTEAAQESASKGKAVIDPDELTDNLTPTAVNPSIPSTSVSLSGDATAILEKGRRAAAELDDMVRSSMLTRDELETAIKTTESRLADEVGRPLVDVNYIDVPLSAGQVVRKVQADIGTSAGRGFLRKSSVDKFLERNGLAGEAVQDSSGQWFARVTKDVAEEDFIKVDLNPKAGNIVSRLLLSARETSDARAFDQSMVAAGRRTRVLREFTDQYDKAFKSLGRDRSTFEAILERGVQDRKWYTPEELDVMYQRVRNKPMPTKFQEAYDKFIELNDIMYSLRNDAVYSDLVRKGFETFSVKSINGLESSVGRKTPIKPNGNSHVYNASDRIHYKRDNPLTEAGADELIQRGYVKLELKDAVSLEDGFRVREVIVHPRDLVSKSLDPVQVGYKPGFHSMYQGKYFVKQTRKGMQPDGAEYLDNPRTFVNARTKGQAGEWAERMNNAIARYVDIEDRLGRTPNDADFADPDLLPEGMSTKQFLDRVEDGTYSKEYKFETLFDREMPAEYTTNTAALRFFDEDANAFEGMLRTNGRTFYNGRGETGLHDHMGNPSQVLTPGETINRALNEVANVVSFGQYREEMLNRWVKTFRDDLDLSGLERASLYDIFEKAEFRKGVSPKIAEAGKAQRDAISRNLNFRSDTMIEQTRIQRQLVESVYGETKDLKSVRGRLGQTTEWLFEADPVQKLRGMAFDLKLGLFNLAQLPLQISTAVAATTISPRAGMKGFMSMPAVWSVQKTTKEQFNRLAKQLIDNGAHKTAGFDDVAEFKQYLEFSRSSGFLDVSFNQIIQDAGNYSFGQSGRQLREAGRVFFNRAELANRTVALRIAWNDIRNNFPKLKTDSDAFRSRVLGRAEDFSFNMQRESGAAWQRGWASIPTQFWSYPARMFESLMGDKFTSGQKLRLLFGQTFMFGSAGVPFASFIEDQWKKETGEAADITSFMGAAQRGFIDKMVYEITGQDVLVGERIGVGSFFTDVIKQFTGNSEFGGNSLAEVAGGASLSIALDVGSDASNVMNYLLAEAGMVQPKSSPDAVLQLAQNVSSFNNVYRAFMVHRYNQYVSTNGKVLADDIPSSQAFLTALSFAPGELNLADAQIKFLQNRKQNIEKTADLIMEYRQKMLRDPANINKYTQEVALLTQMFTPTERRDIYREVKRRTPDDFADSVNRSYNLVRPIDNDNN